MPATFTRRPCPYPTIIPIPIIPPGIKSGIFLMARAANSSRRPSLSCLSFSPCLPSSHNLGDSSVKRTCSTVSFFRKNQKHSFFGAPSHYTTRNCYVLQVHYSQYTTACTVPPMFSLGYLQRGSPSRP